MAVTVGLNESELSPFVASSSTLRKRRQRAHIFSSSIFALCRNVPSLRKSWGARRERMPGKLASDGTVTALATGGAACTDRQTGVVVGGGN